MPEWLVSEVTSSPVLWDDIVWRLILATAFGFAIAAVHFASQRRAEKTILFTTLVLLTILVAMTTIVIGNSIARAFGLVGALSIVRFRTVVEDTRDTAFVIFAVVAGMALGAGNLLVCVIGMPVVSASALFLSRSGILGPPSSGKQLLVRIGSGQDPDQLLGDQFSDQLTNVRLTSVASARQGTAIDLAYVVHLREPRGLFKLVKSLYAVEGVQDVEIKDT